VVHRVTCADYADNAALDRFAADVDVITYEFENVPAQTATFLSARTSVLPDPQVLAITQDRLTEKNFITGLGIATARFAEVCSPAELASALGATGAPAILKTRRFGYDGKGQVKVRDKADAASAWRQIGEQPAILEALVPFEREVSIVAARSRDGRIECFDLIENEHRDHILKLSRVPANVSAAVADEARRIAEAIATAFDYVGVLAVEMFVVAEGGGRHCWSTRSRRACTIPATGRSMGRRCPQFEQHVRAVAGWPLAKPLRHGRIEMTNLIGAEVEDYARWLTVPGASVHLYGKGAPRPGRKMGHVTQVFPTSRG
jgi:5-(carboxyamino)imidazole ribonucleotide synthase